MTLRIEGKKSILKEFSKENLHDPKYRRWIRDLEVIVPISRLEYLMPITSKEVETYVDSLMHSENNCFFSIYHRENDEFIGTLKLGPIDWRTGIANVGIMIGEKKYWGRGIGTDCISIICSYAFEYLSLRKITAGTPAFNVGMKKCFERLGFQQEGNFQKNLLIKGEYVDHIFYGLFKNEFKPLHLSNL